MTPEIYSKSILNKVGGFISDQDGDGLTDYLNGAKKLMGHCTFSIIRKAAITASTEVGFKTQLASELVNEINIENINTFNLGKKGISEQISQLPNLEDTHHRERLRLGIAMLTSLELESPIRAIRAFNNELKSQSINAEFSPIECGLDIAIKVRDEISKGITSDLSMTNVEFLKVELNKEMGVPRAQHKSLPVAKYKM